MSFWNNVEKSDGSMEMGGGDIEPIPAKTQVLASPDEAKWNEYQGEEYISIRWSVLAPKEYVNRKIFQKIKVFDPKKGEKAKRMLAAIDANAGGKLMSSGKQPTSDDLTKNLCNKPMMLLLQVWESEDKSKRGNWVSAVSPRKSNGNTKPDTKPADEDLDQDVPF